MLGNLELFYFCHSRCKAERRGAKWEKKGQINQIIWISGMEEWGGKGFFFVEGGGGFSNPVTDLWCVESQGLNMSD